MRNIARIESITQKIHKIWTSNPDLRFFQLVYLIQSKYSEANSGYGCIEKTIKDGINMTGYDLFNVEDSEFEMFIDKVLNEGLG